MDPSDGEYLLVSWAGRLGGSLGSVKLVLGLRNKIKRTFSFLFSLFSILVAGGKKHVGNPSCSVLLRFKDDVFRKNL